MNDYLPKWACEKLEAMGCVSQTNFYWERDGDSVFFARNGRPASANTQAFHPWDFVGTSEQARKNAVILWGKHLGKHCDEVLRRHACIESDNAVEYICSFLKEGDNEQLHT